jgi:DNA segregation ATPase FtsK/SpoIIIE-like protein
MNHEQKAIIEAAEKEGLLPMEKCARLVVHDMVKATRAQMARYEVGYNKMTEKQQDCVLAELEAAFTDLSLVVARTIASGGTPSVIMTLKSMKIDSKSQITGTVEGNEKYFNELIAKAQDKSEVVLVLYERQFADAMDDIQSDKDQKSLPLEDDGKPGKKAKAAPKAKAEPKPVTIPPKMLDDARDFVVIQQNASVAGLQNLLKIGYEKAIAILKILEGEGKVQWVGDDVNGQYELVRRSSAPSSEPAEAAGGSGDDAEPGDTSAAPVSFDTVDELTDDLYDKIKAKVIADQSVSAGALSVAFDCEFEVAELAIERLETEGVVGEEDDMGGREVLQAA